MVALAVPHALDSEVLLFVSAYFVVRALHVVLYPYGTRDAPMSAATCSRCAPTFVRWKSRRVDVAARPIRRRTRLV
jgi:hypothetical protein